MKTKISGKKFVDRVSGSTGQGVRYERWVKLLYDALNSHDEIQTFDRLAFEAKSFQRLNRLLSTGISDKSAKQKVEVEIRETFKRFLSLLEEACFNMEQDEEEEFRKRFLSPVKSSFDDAMSLLDDFRKIKDYYLMERGSKDES